MVKSGTKTDLSPNCRCDKIKSRKLLGPPGRAALVMSYVSYPKFLRINGPGGT